MFSLHENYLALPSAKGKLLPLVDNFNEFRFNNCQSKLDKDNNDKKKGGRPKKSSVSRKSKTIGVCFSDPELYAIRHRAAKANLPLSVYCHDAVLNGEIKEVCYKQSLYIDQVKTEVDSLRNVIKPNIKKKK